MLEAVLVSESCNYRLPVTMTTIPPHNASSVHVPVIQNQYILCVPLFYQTIYYIYNTNEVLETVLVSESCDYTLPTTHNASVFHCSLVSQDMYTHLD